jgi:hypothetical protein
MSDGCGQECPLSDEAAVSAYGMKGSGLRVTAKNEAIPKKCSVFSAAYPYPSAPDDLVRSLRIYVVAHSLEAGATGLIVPLEVPLHSDDDWWPGGHVLPPGFEVRNRSCIVASGAPMA